MALDPACSAVADLRKKGSHFRKKKRTRQARALNSRDNVRYQTEALISLVARQTCLHGSSSKFHKTSRLAFTEIRTESRAPTTVGQNSRCTAEANPCWWHVGSEFARSWWCSKFKTDRRTECIETTLSDNFASGTFSNVPGNENSMPRVTHQT